MNLKEWISSNRLDAQINSNVCVIDNKKFLILDREESELIFDSDFDLILNPQESNQLIEEHIEFIIFPFGSNWYYTKSDQERVELNIFKYLGEEKDRFDFQFPFLGVHGEYELCNGSKLYKHWCTKAKFLKISTLGICEKNTLAGTLSFQQACKESGIKAILGETVTVLRVDSLTKTTYHVKLYVKDEEGWINLLNINSQIKVFNDGHVTEDYLFSHANGLVCVLCNDYQFSLITPLQVAFGNDIYYQLDFVEWISPEKEKSHLESLKNYIDKYIDIIPPLLIGDAYYLDQQDNQIKSILNSIGKIGFQNSSQDQHFKSLGDIFQQLEQLSPNEEWMDKVFYNALANLVEVNNQCNFEITLNELHLPQYEMTEDEALQFKTNEDLFFFLIQKGLDEKNLDSDEYLARIGIEADLIKRGGFIDYFLITWDILNWCRKNDILTPVGRGSAAGSLISYLLDITQLDPIKYNLLFERFLSTARIGKIVQEEYIIIESEEGDLLSLPSSQEIKISRNSQIIEIKAVDLQSNDIIQ